MPKKTALRRRFGQAHAGDQSDGAVVDARLRAIDADPSRLVSWDDVKRRLGLGADRGKQ